MPLSTSHFCNMSVIMRMPVKLKKKLPKAVFSPISNLVSDDVCVCVFASGG